MSAVNTFFRAYAKADPVLIGQCLHQQISFSDPLFPDLRGARALLRWHWLLRQTQDLSVQHQVIFADDRKAQLKVNVSYSWHGRQVNLPVLTTLTIWDDLIVRHVDEYSYYEYAKQAQGLAGRVLGALPMAQSAVQRRALQAVDELATSAGTILGESTPLR